MFTPLSFILRRSSRPLFLFVLAFAHYAAFAHDADHAGMNMDDSRSPPPFIASTAKPFNTLMNDAMSVMNYDMAHAAMNGQPEHDFVTMMIPHHQGAIDMAKALLLTTQDQGLRNLAQEIIADQQIEIQLMQAWLKAHPAGTAPR
jgi:uncharacterized protein (DUF305 family)